MVMDE
jgi:casein kinase I family protein HRR25